jgi:molybdopterin-guanine dinucleotide biosynthesis protein A
VAEHVPTLSPGDITGLVLAGGRGSRMGGVDKGLQLLRGRPMVQHALERLRPQVGPLIVNANRNLPAYEALGAPVVPDALPDFGGPLTGFLAGLERCETPWLLTVPCDTPFFPVDLAARLGAAAMAEQADIAMASGMEDGALRTQPVFCLLRATLLPSLREFIEGGGRKIDAWTARHRTAVVCFGASAESAFPFVNINTLDQLNQLEHP